MRLNELRGVLASNNSYLIIFTRSPLTYRSPPRWWSFWTRSWGSNGSPATWSQLHSSLPWAPSFLYWPHCSRVPVWGSLCSICRPTLVFLHHIILTEPNQAFCFPMPGLAVALIDADGLLAICQTFLVLWVHAHLPFFLRYANALLP